MDPYNGLFNPYITGWGIPPPFLQQIIRVLVVAQQVTEKPSSNPSPNFHPTQSWKGQTLSGALRNGV